jgi:D-alanyl-D-alanine carboxypeptidase
MIQHRSGIPNFTDAPNFWAAPTKTYEESLALIQGKPANFEPGEDYEYCNTNYLLINKIMDDELRLW